jgi:hypothetical protein
MAQQAVLGVYQTVCSTEVDAMNSPHTKTATEVTENAAGGITCEALAVRGPQGVVLKTRINEDRNIIHHALL